MSNTAVVVTVGATVLTVGGVVTWLYLRKRKLAEDAARSAPAANAAANAAPPAKKMGLADALAFLGGKALTEGIKYASMGPAAYTASVAGKAQKAA